jgi:dTDP-4-dehydrorhamnose reductase
MDILITGGGGLLGSELKKYFPNAFTPSKTELDIKENIKESLFYKSKNFKNIKLVIHCAAIKNTKCTDCPMEAMKTNIMGTANVAIFCEEIKSKMVYISTDYVFKGDKGNYKTTDEVSPVNYYGETKLAGEYVTKSVENHLIIRLSFFPNEFPYESAFYDQYTTRITVSEAAMRIHDAIKKNRKGTIHIAGKRQTSYEYALSTSRGKQIKSTTINFDGYSRPKDTSLLEK